MLAPNFPTREQDLPLTGPVAASNSNILYDYAPYAQLSRNSKAAMPTGKLRISCLEPGCAWTTMSHCAWEPHPRTSLAGHFPWQTGVLIQATPTSGTVGICTAFQTLLSNCAAQTQPTLENCGYTSAEHWSRHKSSTPAERLIWKRSKNGCAATYFP